MNRPTPPYPDYVAPVRRDLNTPLRKRLRDAFLKLSRDYAKQAPILSKLGIVCFHPTGVGDFERRRGTAQSMGLRERDAR